MGRMIINTPTTKAAAEARAKRAFDKIFRLAYDLELVGSYLDDLEDGGEASKAFEKVTDALLEAVSEIEATEKARINRKYDA